MQYIDFKYDGKFLSDYGFIICDFDWSNNAEKVDIGSEITFNKVSHGNGERFTISNTMFEKCIEASFDICKNPDLFPNDMMEITYDEYREIMKWLNRREYSRFAFVDKNVEHSVCYNASFNIQKVTVNDRLYGLRLNMDTDSPFAHGEEIVENFTCSGENDKKVIFGESDDIGFIYPIIEINCLESGNLSINNESDNEVTYIKNVSVGEKIIIDSFYQTIVSTSLSHKIYNDFNYVFFHLVGDRYTEFNSSLNCDILIRYSPIIKATL